MKFKMHVMKLWNYLTSKLSVFFPIMDQVLAWLRKYKNFYFLLGFFAPEKKYPETEKKYRYGIIICARNEHLVIGIQHKYAEIRDVLFMNDLTRYMPEKVMPWNFYLIEL